MNAKFYLKYWKKADVLKDLVHIGPCIIVIVEE